MEKNIGLVNSYLEMIDGIKNNIEKCQKNIEKLQDTCNHEVVAIVEKVEEHQGFTEIEIKKNVCCICGLKNVDEKNKTIFDISVNKKPIKIVELIGEMYNKEQTSNIYTNINRMKKDIKTFEKEINEFNDRIVSVQKECKHDTVLIKKRRYECLGHDRLEFDEDECLYCSKANVLKKKNNQNVLDISDTIYSPSEVRKKYLYNLRNGHGDMGSLMLELEQDEEVKKYEKTLDKIEI